MKVQVVYRTNADYDATYERIRKSDIVVPPSQSGTDCGNIVDEIKESGTKFSLSPKGKLQITWKSKRYKISDFKIIKSLLVPKEGEELFVKEEFLSVYPKIYYPQSNYCTKVHWCDKTYHYEKMFLNPYLSKKDRRLLQLELEAFKLRLKMFYQFEEDSGLFGTPLVLIEKTKRKA